MPGAFFGNNISFCVSYFYVDLTSSSAEGSQRTSQHANTTNILRSRSEAAGDRTGVTDIARGKHYSACGAGATQSGYCDAIVYQRQHSQVSSEKYLFQAWRPVTYASGMALSQPVLADIGIVTAK